MLKIIEIIGEDNIRDLDSETIYFLSKIPSEINVQSIFLIAFCSIIITSIVSIYPAFKASSLDPVKALKYE